MTTHTYNGYKVAVGNGVRVYDPRFPKDPALYRTSCVALAEAWIDAYRDGQAWASNEALYQRDAFECRAT